MRPSDFVFDQIYKGALKGGRMKEALTDMPLWALMISTKASLRK